MRYRTIIILVIFSLCSMGVYAQYFSTGQDPASLKWLQIKTGLFTVIYPEKYDSAGIAFAKSLDDAYSKLGPLFPIKKFSIPVIIHNYTTKSNGYVAWAPKRMEIYPTPEQNTIPLDPNKQLAIHELTHVLQMESLNKGFSKGMQMLLGEQFNGIVAFLLPLWFFEGQAVFAETALTQSGRGRTPSFQKQFKALVVEKKKNYNYDKIVNGSFRNFVPDHYQSGYQMVTWALLKHDPQTWNKVLNNTAIRPYTINPVNLSLLKSTGLRKKTLYKETFDTLKTIWTKSIYESNATSYLSLNPEKDGNYINYYSPVIAGNDSIIAIKTSLSTPAAFVLINISKKTEERIHTPGLIYPYYFSYAGKKFVWIETQFDPRWDNREYSVIKLLDLGTNKISRLSKKSRYLSATLSPDGKTIAAVENTIDNINSISFIDAETGIVMKSVPSPGNAYLQKPQWDERGRIISLIYLTEEGEGIITYNIFDQEWNSIIEPGINDIQSSFLRNDSLFFISSVTGTDNIFLQTPDKKITLLSNSRFGASDLYIKGNKILFSDYTSFGNSICSIKLTEYAGKENEYIDSSSFLINRYKTESETSKNQISSSYIPKPYRKWQHLFKFHSWMPFYADIEEIKTDPASVRPGITLLTQNSLSTLVSSIGYEYTQEKNHVFHSRITWKGWYPVFESRLDYGYDPYISKSGETVNNPSVTQPGYSFINTISLPLFFSSGRFFQFIRPSFSSDYINRYVYISDQDYYDHGQNILTGRLYLSNYYRSALRDIYPRWSQTIDINYTFAPFDRILYGTDITVKTAFYFPGIFPNNSIKIRIEKEKQIPEQYLYFNKASHPRGYKNIISKELELISVDYVFPLAYPDFNIASLLYIKRIRSSLFYDYARGKGNNYYEHNSHGLSLVYSNDNQDIFRSFGFELMADLHIFRIPYMISGGVQTTWKGVGETPSFEFLFNFDLFGMSINKDRL